VWGELRPRKRGGTREGKGGSENNEGAVVGILGFRNRIGYCGGLSKEVEPKERGFPHDLGGEEEGVWGGVGGGGFWESQYLECG